MPGMHYFIAFWKFHQHHWCICSTMCLWRVENAGPGWEQRTLLATTVSGAPANLSKEDNLPLGG